MRFRFTISPHAISCCLAAASIPANTLKSDMPAVAKVLLVNLSARSHPPQITIKGAASDHNVRKKKKRQIFANKYVISAWQVHTVPVPSISVCTWASSHNKTQTLTAKKCMRVSLFCYNCSRCIRFHNPINT